MITGGNPFEYRCEERAVRLLACEVPWDTEVFSMKVWQIEKFEVKNIDNARRHLEHFMEWVHSQSVGMISCRLPHDRLQESMLLEGLSFRFIEMVLHPECAFDYRPPPVADPTLTIEAAEEKDIPLLREIAEHAFGVERCHVDPRLNSPKADLRYGRWVAASLGHASQKLIKICEGQKVVGFFILQIEAGNTVNWLLTAIAPGLQGKGYGRRVWSSMLNHHFQQGMKSVRTTISARNVPVLNLYSSLGFRFQPPEMTFHWVNP